MHHLPATEKLRGWILYDASCGFCSSWIYFWHAALAKRGFDIAPLQSDWVAEEYNLPKEQLRDDLRLLLKDGTKLRGADAYRFIMKHIWWAFPVYLLAIFPGTRKLFDLGYSAFARNRFHISSACNLSGKV
jgi:predicted DCC family thiol-disulfide oxidoreductase YuxK